VTRTLPTWFLLLFPIAVPAVFVLDFLGYTILSKVLLAILGVLCLLTLYAAVAKVRFFRRGFVTLAESLLEPGSWTLRHYPYHHTLSGRFGGRTVHVSLLGHETGSLSQLFLEAPVDTALQLDSEEPGAADALPGLRELRGRWTLRALPRREPAFRRLLSGTVASGGPGLVLRKWYTDLFAPALVRRDLEVLLRAAEAATRRI